MHRLILLVAITLGLGDAGAAVAAPPPQDSKPMSQIIQSLEQRGYIAYFDEIEWDDDGYWEIEYFTQAGAKVKIRVDPTTGERRR